MNRLLLLAATLLLGIWGCGDKVPESSEARRIGEAPKQVIDKASADITKAVEQGVARSSDGEKDK